MSRDEGPKTVFDLIYQRLKKGMYLALSLLLLLLSLELRVLPQNL